MNSVPYIVPLLLIGEGNMTRSKQQHNVLSGIKHALSGSSSNSYAKLNDSETSPPKFLIIILLRVVEEVDHLIVS